MPKAIFNTNEKETFQQMWNYQSIFHETRFTYSDQPKQSCESACEFWSLITTYFPNCEKKMHKQNNK